MILMDVHIDNLHYLNDILCIKNEELVKKLPIKIMHSLLEQFGHRFTQSLSDWTDLFVLVGFHPKSLANCACFPRQRTFPICPILSDYSWKANSPNCPNNPFLRRPKRDLPHRVVPILGSRAAFKAHFSFREGARKVNTNCSSHNLFFSFLFRSSLFAALHDGHDDHACFFAFLLIYCIFQNPGSYSVYRIIN